MLTHPEEVHADTVGQHSLVDYVSDRLSLGDQLPCLVLVHISERVQTQLEDLGHETQLLLRLPRFSNYRVPTVDITTTCCSTPARVRYSRPGTQERHPQTQRPANRPYW